MLWLYLSYRRRQTLSNDFIQALALSKRLKRAADAAAKQAENVKKKADYAKRKRGTHSNHRLIKFIN